MTAAGPTDPADGIEPGKRLIRLEGERGTSLGERLAGHLHRLAWRTPWHSFRLSGRYPLKLLAVPEDPCPGDASVGQAMLEGRIVRGGETVEIETLNFGALSVSPAFQAYLHRFDWLRDLAAAAPRGKAAPVAELITRQWLAVHGTSVTAAGWRGDHWGHRIFNWAAHAPLILSSHDLVYRSAVLNGLARGARHLDRGAERTPAGLPRIAAFTGTIAAGLLIPGGEARLAHGEAGLARALAATIYADGGSATRSPERQLELVELLARLRAVYYARGRTLTAPVEQALAKAVSALLGVTLGDGALSSWQSGGPIPAARIQRAVEAAGVRARPLRQARDWGYQRLASGQTTLIIDAAPPPVAKLAAGGCASTLAFEMSDGPYRLVVNCGGAGNAAGLLPDELAQALRTTAAHSTLIVNDSNSTALHPDGALGKGVTEVELDRQEVDNGSRLEASHDGYVRRFGFTHNRQLLLSPDGRELRGEDVLLPAGRKGRNDGIPFAVRFHLAPHVEVSSTADGMGALLRIADGALWQFRCRGGALTIEDSLWVDAKGRPLATHQLVVSGEAPAGGASVGWLLRRAG